MTLATPIRRMMFVVLATFGLALAVPAGHAGDAVIEAAKDAGVVGERIDGYLGFVKPADANVQRRVEEINARRRTVYDDLARRTGESTATVARLTGEKQIADADGGEFVMDASGTWRQK